MTLLQTNRLLIRNFGASDWEALHEMICLYQASELAAYDQPWPTSPEQVKSITEWFAGGGSFLAVCLKGTGQLIGFVARMISLRPGNQPDRRRSMTRPNISAGYFRSGLPFNRFGEGSRIAVIFQGLQFEHKPLTGLSARLMTSMYRFLDAEYTTYLVTRRSRLPHGYSMRDMADDYARTIREEFGGPVDVIGTSTGGSIAQLKNRLAEIRVPTLVVAGENDPFYTAELFRETAAGIPHARLILYAGMGHPAMGKPFERDVLAFLVEHDTLSTDAERDTVAKSIPERRP